MDATLPTQRLKQIGRQILGRGCHLLGVREETDGPEDHLNPDGPTVRKLLVKERDPALGDVARPVARSTRHPVMQDRQHERVLGIAIVVDLCYSP